MKLTRQEIAKLAVSTMNLGLLIDLAGAALLFVIAQFLRNQGIVEAVRSEKLNYLGYGLLFVGAVEILLVFVLRRRWISPESEQFAAIKKRPTFYKHFKLSFVILYFIALTPSIYGFLFYLLGGQENLFVFMLVETLIGYMAIRIRPDGLEKAIGMYDLEDPG